MENKKQNTPFKSGKEGFRNSTDNIILSIKFLGKFRKHRTFNLQMFNLFAINNNTFLMCQLG